MPRLAATVRICGNGITALRNLKGARTASDLMAEALEKALSSAKLDARDLDGLLAVPSLSHPHLMEAHYLATKINLLPRRDFLVRTIDTGGAGPITAILQAKRMIESENREAVAVVAGDAVSSLGSEEFLRRADSGVGSTDLPSPVIPNGYSRVTEWHMNKYGLKREQLAKVSVLMSRQASRHPDAFGNRVHTLREVLESPKITPQLNLLECARRMDGAAAVIIASSSFLEKRGLLDKGNGGNGDVVILAGGEASGPLYPPKVIDETMFSSEQAVRSAYTQAQLRPDEIDFFALYDCFPICFIRAVESVGLAEKGRGGEWVDQQYEQMLKDPDFVLPVNSHGGLLSFGAPWEAPILFGVYEAIRQLTRQAGKQQVPHARRALVYGNGGIFSSSSVAILSKAIEF